MSLRLTVAFVILASSTHGEARQSRPGPPGFEPLPPGTGAICGRVVDAHSGEPLANVDLMLAETRGRASAKATTDTAGFYHFANLAESDYHVYALDPLYLRACHGATDAAQLQCGPVAVIRDQARTGIDLPLTLAAVLTGRIVDVDGRAVSGATVLAGPAPSMSPSFFLPAAGQTRPDGTFEITRLASGDTVLSLDMPVTADRPRAPRVFYPGVLTAEAAEAIRLTGGLVTSGITFRYPKIAVRSITTRISSPAAGATAIKAWLYRVEPRMVRAIALDADGAGNVRGLLEGRYFVAAEAQGDGEPLVASGVVELVDDAVELALLLQEPGRITGRVVAERGGLPPLTDVRVAAKWSDEGEEINPLAADDVAVGPDGSFRIDGLFGSRSVQLLGLSPEWRIQSIRRGRNEIPANGVTVESGATLDLLITIGRR